MNGKSTSLEVPPSLVIASCVLRWLPGAPLLRSLANDGARFVQLTGAGACLRASGIRPGRCRYLSKVPPLSPEAFVTVVLRAFSNQPTTSLADLTD